MGPGIGWCGGGGKACRWERRMCMLLVKMHRACRKCCSHYLWRTDTSERQSIIWRDKSKGGLAFMRQKSKVELRWEINAGREVWQEELKDRLQFCILPVLWNVDREPVTGQHVRSLFGRSFFIFADVTERSGRLWQRLAVVVYLFIVLNWRDSEIFFGLAAFEPIQSRWSWVVKSPFLDWAALGSVCVVSDRPTTLSYAWVISPKG